MGKHSLQAGKAIKSAKTDEPLDPKAGSPGQRSRLRAATDIQSSVNPKDYPAADREQQVAAATAGPKAK